MVKQNVQKHKEMHIIISIVCAKAVLSCLRLPMNNTSFFLMALLLTAVSMYNINKAYDNYENILLLIFNILFSASCVLGAHIQINSSQYRGVMSENVILSYGWIDLLGLVAIASFGWKLTRIICFKLEESAAKGDFAYHQSNQTIRLLVPGCLMLAWLPYFLVNYPAVILGDSCSSIFQALGLWQMSNHHPVVYTLFIRICIQAGMLIGQDATIGLALYAMAQMLILAFAISKLVLWLREKGANRYVCFVILLFLGLSPFFGNISVVVWKDPIFSALILLWTLKIYDISSLNEDGGVISLKDHMQNICLMAGCCLIRNNGVYVVLFWGMAELLINILAKRKIISVVVIEALVVSIVLAIVPGKIYSRMGVAPSEKVESVGLMLNQMARVAAYDGDMSEDDRDFLNELMPIDLYKEKYRPCVVDMLKWDSSFNNAYLEEHMPEFFKTYVSLLAKNPKLMIEGWELTTYGYWAPNRWELFSDAENIIKGNLGDYTNTGMDKYVKKENVLNKLVKNLDFEKIFTIQGDIVALANVIWIIIFSAFIMMMKKKWEYLSILTPSIGLIITLWIASPYYYWQRYGLALYYTVPVCLMAVKMCLKKEHENDQSCIDIKRRVK